jgi:hypothetical protein
VFAQACSWYHQLFGDRAVELYRHDCEAPTVSPRRGVRVGGWVDLTVVGTDGTKELRQFDLWGGRSPGSDPLDHMGVRVAVLRLSRWVDDGPLRVSWSDLVRGERSERAVDAAAELPRLRAEFDERLACVRARVAEPVASPGADCGSCAHLWRCPAHPAGIDVAARRGDTRPAVITLTPTAYETWLRCRRAWRSQYLLLVPASDDDAGPHHGRAIHDLLRFVHEHGSCHDRGHVDEVLDAHGADARLREELERHVARCPMHASAVGHEIDVARFHRDPWPPFMATARLDAAWVHDGILDVRDYKSGRRWHERVADDPRARVQAWVAARLAEERGLRLRVRYEYLATEVDDDAEPWDPDADDLAAVEEELRTAVEAIRAEEHFAGVADATVCGTCRYRSICRDSAARAEPVWPAVLPDPIQPVEAIEAAPLPG